MSEEDRRRFSGIGGWRQFQKNDPDRTINASGALGTPRSRQLARIGADYSKGGLMESELTELLLKFMETGLTIYQVDLGHNVIRTLIIDEIDEDHIDFHTKLKGDDEPGDYYRAHLELEALPVPGDEVYP